MGILIDPYMMYPVPAAIINGPIRLLGSNCGRYAVKLLNKDLTLNFAFQFTLAIFFGAGAFWNQIYCLIFRYTAIQQHFHNLNKKFNRWPVRFGFTVLGYTIQIVCAYFAFFCMMTTEVCERGGLRGCNNERK
jgi:hypothetical protein